MKVKYNLKNILFVNNFGIGRPTLVKSFNYLGVNTKKYNPNHILEKNKKIIDQLNLSVSGKKLKKIQKEFINFAINIKTYKGMRNKYRYPARGQRTHNNSRTKKKFIF
jgi:small subunit ribosomal protein S13